MRKLNTNQQALKDWYISSFEQLNQNKNGKDEIPFKADRAAAISKFAELDLPSKRDEEWKYSNLTPLYRHKFQIPDKPASMATEALQPFLFNSLEENLLVFINGHYVKELSNYQSLHPQVIIDSLANAFTHHPELIRKYLAKFADIQKSTFTALNTAFAMDGLFLYLPDHVVVERPLHLLFLSDSRNHPFISHPRNLMIAGKNSQMSIIESYHSLARESENSYFNNMVTEVLVQENARLKHIKLQDESTSAYHISTLQVQQWADSYYSLVNIDMGGSLVRNNLNIALDATNCESHLVGLYMGTAKQYIDNHSLIGHYQPHCFSNELYKGILGGKAQGVFNGKVYVKQDAQKTNAYQNNQALLLTEQARVNSKPELEIFADDVKCSHGATVGQLDEDALFYLRSRGIPREEAYSILQYAFASEIFDYIYVEPVKEKIDKIVFERFKQL